ncbi:ribosome maturation factor RimP [Desulfuromonas thiophila]|uniref:Ribosome maturation factor RimP n=1 Tax=Desulfuromonas thiophila TaxID=57664 RepID=A0A1G7C2E6_9BACT|nr:ribosome maturation factor RimP [Desulfuromonas thiophila]SDE33459.1 ribosome maturation factor RimP [Desulfuromonas thiophila]
MLKDRATLLERVRQLAQPVLEQNGLELVDSELVQQGRSWFLRLFIDKAGGVTLDDCADFSRELDTLLDVEEVLSVAYRLEVSSPGLDRPLKRPQDFERFRGEPVRLKTHQLLDPDGRGHQRKTFSGILLGLEDGLVRVQQTDRKGGVVALPLADIEKIHLDPQF